MVGVTGGGEGTFEEMGGASTRGKKSSMALQKGGVVWFFSRPLGQGTG